MPSVIESSIARYEQQSKLKLMRIPDDKRDAFRDHLEKKLERAEDHEEFQKSLTKEEVTFIRNERVMSILDFSYWSHYATIQRDGGGICNFDQPLGIYPDLPEVSSPSWKKSSMNISPRVR